MRTVYVIGLPGSGKSTMVETAIRMTGLQSLVMSEPVPHIRYDWLWTLGRPRDAFGGTDTLSMSIQRKAVSFVLGLEAIEPCGLGPRVLLGEGDRLANAGFFAACPNLTIVYLDTPIGVARARAAYRAQALGRRPQNASWWKGRVTKTDNLIATHRHVRYDGTRLPRELASDLVDVLYAGRDTNSAAQ